MYKHIVRFMVLLRNHFILGVTTEGKKKKKKRHLHIPKLFKEKNLIEFFTDLDR